MKRNLITIVILAMAIINVVLTAVIVFVMVPTSNKTNALVAKVAQVIDLELESKSGGIEGIAVSDIETYDIPDKLTIRLKSDGREKHYAIVYASLSLNKKHSQYEELQPIVKSHENRIKEIITDEFSKYQDTEVNDNKENIKESVINQLRDLFASDFIINVSFGNFIVE